MNPSDTIAILALVVSVVLGSLNIWYKRKKFQASIRANTPELQILNLELERDRIEPLLLKFRIRNFKIGVKNLHSNIHVVDVRILASVANPFKAWRFLKKWRTYADRTFDGVTIPPLEFLALHFSSNKYAWFEEFLAAEFPSLIKTVEINSPVSNVRSVRYCVVNPKPLKLTATAKLAYKDFKVCGGRLPPIGVPVL